MAEDEECYVGSSRKRPKKNLSGGFGEYCCVPGCKSAYFDSNREKTGISLFKIPSKDRDRRNWIRILKNIRRKGSFDDFNPNKKSVYVCEF